MEVFRSTSEVAKDLGLTRQQVARLAKQGYLPCVRRGRLILFPAGAWRLWVAEQDRIALADMEEKKHAIV